MKNKITQNNNYSDRVIQALFQCIDQLFTHNKLQLIARTAQQYSTGHSG